MERQRLRETLTSEDVARVIHGALRRLGAQQEGWEASWVQESPQVRGALRSQVQAIRLQSGTAAEIRQAAGMPVLDERAMAIEEMVVGIVRALALITELDD